MEGLCMGMSQTDSRLPELSSEGMTFNSRQPRI